MKDEYKDYYLYLERLRKSGETNMYGAGPYLVNEFGISLKDAHHILSDWMINYSEISKKYYNKEDK